MKKIFIVIMLILTLNIFGGILPVSAQTNWATINTQNVQTADQNSRLNYNGFVNCDGVAARQYDAKGNDVGPKPGEEFRQNVCNFAAFFGLFNKIINWLFIISIPIATVLFAYAGLLYIRGSSGSINQAKAIFTSVAIGFIIMLVAWFGVRTFVNWFVESNAGATSFIGQ